jgi:hypothetical protein
VTPLTHLAFQQRHAVVFAEDLATGGEQIEERPRPIS